MPEKTLSLPEIALFGGTRVALGIGVGLLISRRLNRFQREAAGVALVAVGALTTIPFAIQLRRQGKKAQEHVTLAA